MIIITDVFVGNLIYRLYSINSGKHPFSEPESLAIKSFLDKISNNYVNSHLVLAINLFAEGTAWLTPWHDNSEVPLPRFKQIYTELTQLVINY